MEADDQRMQEELQKGQMALLQMEAAGAALEAINAEIAVQRARAGIMKTPESIRANTELTVALTRRTRGYIAAVESCVSEIRMKLDDLERNPS